MGKLPKKPRNRPNPILIVLRNLYISLLYLIAYLCFCLLFDPGSVLESNQLTQTLLGVWPIAGIVMVETFTEIAIRCS